MRLEIKPFEALTVPELYALLRLRSEIFVVEQECVYLDLDGKDDRACMFWHGKARTWLGIAGYFGLAITLKKRVLEE